MPSLLLRQQMDDLTRGYTQSKADYDVLLKKKNDSEMATSMEQMQQGERFTMIDPPSLSLKPDFPNRLKFCEMGLGVRHGAGLGFGGRVLNFLDGRLYSEKEIKTLVPVAIISEVPEVLLRRINGATRDKGHWMVDGGAGSSPSFWPGPRSVFFHG